ncbi:MAG: NAD(P)/FAD-dependent oxidoreductase [Herbaspirillum sp.]
MPIAAAADAVENPASEFEDVTLDVLIVGAGLSGIGAAYHLQQRCPAKRYAILEMRDAIGGTWDLFRYPGVRSDSDMYTLGYAFKPWLNAKAIADGAEIRHYVVDTADEAGITPHIRFGQKVISANWSSQEACWTVQVLQLGSGHTTDLRTRFLYLCSGYYDYAEGHRPEFVGEQDYQGRVVHPQFWPEQLDYAGKRVIVIGSGATAVTLVPTLAKTAAHVTMLQRSPTYIATRPSEDAWAQRLQRFLPERLSYDLVRWKNVLLGMMLFRLARRQPEQFKRRIVELAAAQLEPGYDVKTHFTPNYKPWDQRICLVPDGDLFAVLRTGRASVVTDHIDCFTAHGLRLESGRELQADIVVMATGLKLNALGGINLSVDGTACEASRSMAYKGMLLSDVPNFALSFGYTNASWTLKADLTAVYVCRLLRYMDKHHHAIAVARRDNSVTAKPFLDFSSGYVLRAAKVLPQQGSSRPWQVYQSYLQDMLTIRFSRIADGVVRFGNKGNLP